MANDWQNDPPETDGTVDPSVDPYAPTAAGIPAVESEPEAAPEPQSPPPRPSMPRPDQPPIPHRGTAVRLTADEIDEGKTMALLSHGSILLGIPLFVIPMMQRDNEFALHHSKAAAVNFGFFVFTIVITMVTCGLAFPLIFLVYVPAIVGAVNAANGDLAGTWGWGGAGEKIFPRLRADKKEPKQLDHEH